MNKTFLFFILSLLSLSLAVAQTKISGKVMDKKTKKGIPYVDVLFPGLNVHTMTNTDGTFYIQTLEDVTTLEISKEGYLIKTVQIEQKIVYELDVFLEEEVDDFLNDDWLTTPSGKEDNSIKLQTATVVSKKKKYKNKKENPAWAILRELWNRKRKNGLNIVPQYEYKEYEKLEFDINNIDSAFLSKKIFKGFEFLKTRIDTSSINGKAYLPAFLNESIYKVYGKNNPKQFKKELIANKSSGFDNNEILIQTAKNLNKEFDIYDNRLNFFDLNFVSPVARDGFSVYDYELRDTLEVDGVQCYHIKYFPKRDGELTFKGDVYISTDTYAVKDVAMETTKDINVNFVSNIYVSLRYDVKNDSIFYPKRDYILLDMSLLSKRNKAKGMFVHKTVTYHDFDFSKELPSSFYTKRYDPYLAGAYDLPDDYWSVNRPDSLTAKELGIYETLDSLQKIPKFKMIINAAEIVASGYVNVGNAIDIGNLYSSFGNNKIEGIRVRVGARTYFSTNDPWRIQAYTAYGFKDSEFKYGVEGRYMFNRINRFQIGLGNKMDVEQLGSQLNASSDFMQRGMGSSHLFSQGNNNYMLSKVNQTSFYTSIDPWNNVTFRLNADYQIIRSADADMFSIDYLKNGIVKNKVTNTNLSFSIMTKPWAKYSQNGIDRYEHGTLSPTFLLKYTRGIKGLFDGDFSYDKIQFSYNQPILIGSLGKSILTVEAGKTFQGLPLSLLNTLPANESYVSSPGAFSQMNYYEFVSDTYAIFLLDHHFNGWLFSKLPLIKKLKLREVGFFRAAWGDISDKSKDINASSSIISYRAPKDKIYMEYGFGIENIGWGNIRPFRVDFNWRGNYKNMPDARKFGVTFGVMFDF